VRKYREVKFHVFLTSALGGNDWLASHSGRFTLRERAPGTYCILDWVESQCRESNVSCSTRFVLTKCLLVLGLFNEVFQLRCLYSVKCEYDYEL